jgi:hypothetical protein
VPTLLASATALSIVQRPSSHRRGACGPLGDRAELPPGGDYGQRVETAETLIAAAATLPAIAMQRLKALLKRCKGTCWLTYQTGVSGRFRVPRMREFCAAAWNTKMPVKALTVHHEGFCLCLWSRDDDVG